MPHDAPWRQQKHPWISLLKTERIGRIMYTDQSSSLAFVFSHSSRIQEQFLP